MAIPNPRTSDPVRFADPLFPMEPSRGALHGWAAGETNLAYVVQTAEPSRVLAVDVPDGRGLLRMLGEREWTLAGILLTHTHHDHVRHLAEVLAETGCPLFGAEPFRGLPRRQVVDGMSWRLEGLNVVAWDTSGHTACDITYLLPDAGFCFCADTLFGWGCGRMFAGPPERFWRSLERLRSLPDETRMCCGHDYRAENAAFLEGELPGLPGVAETVRAIRADLEAGGLQQPLLLGDQKRGNPFLRADDPEVARAIGRAGASPAEVFSELRRRRNGY